MKLEGNLNAYDSFGRFANLGGILRGVLVCFLLACQALPGATSTTPHPTRATTSRSLSNLSPHANRQPQDLASSSGQFTHDTRAPLLRRNFTLPHRFRHAAVSTIVPTMQTYKLARLLRGDLGKQTLRMAVLGGSFSCSRHNVTSWFMQLAQELSQLLPHVTIDAVNRARGGAHPYHACFCLESLLGNDTYDLVFLEFNPNTLFTLHHPAGGNSSRLWSLQFEMLVRKLLGWPGSPQVILVQTIIPRIVDGKPLDFYEGSEEGMGVVAKYYSLAAISMRDALWNFQHANLSGFKRDDLRMDGFHLSQVGVTYLVDMVVHCLEEMVGAVAEEDELAIQGEQLRPALFHDDDLTHRAMSPQLLPPMIAGLEVPKTRICWRVGLTNISDARALNLIIKPSAGFRFDDGGVTHEKLGFVTDAEQGAGEHIEFTWTPPKPGEGTLSSSREGATVLLVVVFFIGHKKQMGAARMSCVAGCKCAPVTVSALQLPHFTFESIVTLAPTSWAKDGSCTISVRVQAGPQQGTKFKVTQLWVLEGSANMSTYVRTPY